MVGRKAMKATDLMIGDKVMVNVLSQIPNTYALHTWTANDYSRDIQVKPIQLTPKILEKNGWERKGNYMIIKVGKITLYWVEYLDCGLYKNEYNMCTCKYVHQLQHALRLCGFDTLADTFKI